MLSPSSFCELAMRKSLDPGFGAPRGFPQLAHASASGRFACPQTKHAQGSTISGTCDAPQCGQLTVDLGISLPQYLLMQFCPMSTAPHAWQASISGRLSALQLGHWTSLGGGGWSAASTSFHHSASS